jgi:hypothetical protein
MKKKIQILSIISSACLAALLLSVFFGFSENNDFSLSRKTAAASLIRTVYNGDSAAEGSDDLLLISEVVQTKYDTQAASVSFQGNLAAIEEGRIDLNDRSFEVKRGSFYWSTATEPESTEPSQAYFGADNSFRVDGEEIVRSFYVPRSLKLEFENGRDLEFNRAEGIRFRWNPDERNEYPLVVVLQYIPEEGKELLTKQFRFSDREQAAEITAEDLKEFPSDAKLILYAGRGNGKIVPIRGRETSLTGLTITSVPGVVLR